MSWRVALALRTLLEQVNALAPERAKSDDGTIASDEHHHQNPKSDHEADANGIVHAMDLTHDPRGGFDSYKFADMLISPGHRDKRIKYVISNRRIAGDEAYARRNGVQPWTWRRYTGTNPHDHHVHISVNAANGDDPQKWNLGDIPTPDPGAPVVPTRPILRRGSQGAAVRELQKALGLLQDGDFGPVTEKAVKAFQKAQGLISDGVVGSYTWEALLAHPAPPHPVMNGVQENITATVFGGTSEIERSAYDGHRIGENEYAVALPFRFSGERRHVKVTNAANGKSAVASIEDIGPWNINDPYWQTRERPQAESGRDKSGRRTNRAGIDLSPALARAIGIDGIGKVHWEFV